MASWKKVIVSGSTANLAALQVDNLTSGNVVIGGGAGSNLSTTAINGTGNIVATTAATGLSHSGSFSGSFLGTLTSTLANVNKANIVGYDTATGLFSYQSTSSFTAASASFALTASYVPTAILTASVNNSTITFTKFDGSTFNITVSQSGSVASASYAENANLLDGLDSTAFVLNSQTSSMSVLNAVTASYVLNAVSASYALRSTSASYASNADLLDGLDSTAFVLNSQTGSMSVLSASYANFATSAGSATTAATASFILGSNVVGTVASATSASYALNSTSASYANFATSAGSANTASYVLNAVSASYALNSTSASQAVNVSSIANNVSNNVDNRVLTATGAGSINGEANLTFDGSLLTVTGNQIITGDLTVQGTTTTLNTDNLLVEDRFILLASGSTTPTDGGIIIQSGYTGNTARGLALMYDSNTARWGYTSSLDFNATSAVPDAFASIVLDLDNGSSDVATYQKNGNIKVSSGDIFIYS